MIGVICSLHKFLCNDILLTLSCGFSKNWEGAVYLLICPLYLVIGLTMYYIFLVNTQPQVVHVGGDINGFQPLRQWRFSMWWRTFLDIEFPGIIMVIRSTVYFTLCRIRFNRPFRNWLCTVKHVYSDGVRLSIAVIVIFEYSCVINKGSLFTSNMHGV